MVDHQLAGKTAGYPLDLPQLIEKLLKGTSGATDHELVGNIRRRLGQASDIWSVGLV